MRILKIESLPPAKQWLDRDIIMLHACFQLLQDCVEKEEVDTHCNYEAHKEFVDEVRFLYNWWLTRKDGVWGKPTQKDGIWTNPIQECEKEDDEMLIRLMKIRRSLWT